MQNCAGLAFVACVVMMLPNALEAALIGRVGWKYEADSGRDRGGGRFRARN